MIKVKRHEAFRKSINTKDVGAATPVGFQPSVGNTADLLLGATSHTNVLSAANYIFTIKAIEVIYFFSDSLLSWIVCVDCVYKLGQVEGLHEDVVPGPDDEHRVAVGLAGPAKAHQVL